MPLNTTPASPSTASDARALAWNAALSASPGALDLHIPASAIEGAVPGALRGGRLLSNGPGWTRIGDRLAHPFDGHGYVRAFELGPDGSCRLRARFVETPSYQLEAQHGRLMHRGLATNLGPPFWRNLGFGPQRNVANTTITRFGGRLLAGWEGGAPTALDPKSLDTLGEEHLGGALAGTATLAHWKRDHGQGRLVFCSVAQGRDTRFTFREVEANGRVAQTREAALPGVMFTHDFTLTPSWYVLGGNPLRFKPAALAGMLLGTGTLLGALATDPRPTGALHLVPRGGDGPVRTVSLPDRAWVVHFGGAFERDGAVIVDAAIFSRFELGNEFGYTGPLTPFDPSLPEARGPQRLTRITIPPGATEARWEPLTAHGVDFPRIHPQHEGLETPALFGATRRDVRYSDPFDSIIRVDLLGRRAEAIWTAPENVFVGEPVFVPEAGSDEAGWVLVILSHGGEERSTLAIFDALALEAGPVAAVPLPLLPVAFHGDWDGDA